MSTITTRDGIEIFYKDWGKDQPIVFSHGWPLSADDLKNAIHVGHSTGGGEVAHYLGRHGESRVAKAVLIRAVPPLMVKTEKNPGGLPKEVFDGLQGQRAANRLLFYRYLAS